MANHHSSSSSRGRPTLMRRCTARPGAACNNRACTTTPIRATALLPTLHQVMQTCIRPPPTRWVQPGRQHSRGIYVLYMIGSPVGPTSCMCHTLIGKCCYAMQAANGVAYPHAQQQQQPYGYQQAPPWGGAIPGQQQHLYPQQQQPPPSWGHAAFSNGHMPAVGASPAPLQPAQVCSAYPHLTDLHLQLLHA